jgi:hypothetical protein
MRSAPTLKIWMTPFASVAMLEKLALLKIALCRAPVRTRASALGTSTAALSAPAGAGGSTNRRHRVFLGAPEPRQRTNRRHRLDQRFQRFD